MRTRHGEVESVSEAALQAITAISASASGNNLENMYNMDKTGLLLRSSLSKGLLTESLPGVKKNKS